MHEMNSTSRINFVSRALSAVRFLIFINSVMQWGKINFLSMFYSNAAYLNIIIIIYQELFKRLFFIIKISLIC
jgi:hypothetical protein